MSEPPRIVNEGKRWRQAFSRWLGTIPGEYRDYIDRIMSAQGAASQRADTAERRERDAARHIESLKRRIAELESRP